jgi:hypothetical protein
MLMKRNGDAMMSNEHELRAVEKALRFGMATGEIRRGDDVWLRSDSTTVVFNVNRQAAGINLRPALRSLLRFAEENEIRLRAEHVPGVQNLLPDALSRLSPSGDYSLRAGILDKALKKLGVQIDIDWFANRKNRQHERYCTLAIDKHAAVLQPNGRPARDAMAQNWSALLGLLHPPIPMFVRCLRKVRAEHATAVLIAPDWRGQVWTPMLRLMTMKAVTLGTAAATLQMGAEMRKKGGSLPPGKIAAYLISG